MKILFKYATRSRRSEFLRGIDSIVNNLADKNNYHILITIDGDDSKMHPLPVLSCNHTFIIGQSEGKIHAINRDLDKLNYDWDILVCMSDDMVFTKYGFDNVIRDRFNEDVFIDCVDQWANMANIDRFIHFPDGNRSDLCTMSIMGREYYERDQYIYHPEYKSLYCDNEAQEVAKIRGCYKFVDTQIFEHLHPAYGKAHFDEQYQRTEAIGNTVDRETYLRRKQNNFNLNTMKLSILIPSLEERYESYNKVVSELNKQISEAGATNEVEIISSIDNREKLIGLKRNELQAEAKGKYSCFFDDDDWPSSDYISKILKAIEEDKDCCSFTGVITFDGQTPEIFEHSLKYSEWKTNDTGEVKYERYPNHLNVIKTDIAKQYLFPLTNHGEDHDWSTQLHKAGVLKTEAVIPGVIYHYQYVTNK